MGIYIMKGGAGACDPCSDESRRSSEVILASLKATEKLIKKREKECPISTGPSLEGAVTAVVAANRLKKNSETKKSRDPTHWHLYENDSGKYWENGDGSEAFWVMMLVTLYHLDGLL